MKQIVKCSAIIVQNKKILLTRKKGSDIFISPGGKLHPNESHFSCLERELKEEVSLQLMETIFFNEFLDAAAIEKDTQIHSIIYYCSVHGSITVNNEIAEAKFFSLNELSKHRIGSTFEKYVIPVLKKEGSIR